MKRILTFATLLLVLSSTAPADVFKWVDEEGRVHYSDDGATAAEDAETLTENEGNIADPFVIDRFYPGIQLLDEVIPVAESPPAEEIALDESDKVFH